MISWHEYSNSCSSLRIFHHNDWYVNFFSKVNFPPRILHLHGCTVEASCAVTIYCIASTVPWVSRRWEALIGLFSVWRWIICKKTKQKYGLDIYNQNYCVHLSDKASDSILTYPLSKGRQTYTPLTSPIEISHVKNVWDWNIFTYEILFSFVKLHVKCS